MRCEQCGFENEEDAKFCGNCGASLAPRRLHPPAAKPASGLAQVYCQQCGTPNAEGSVFCYSCGSKLAPEAMPRRYPKRKRRETTKEKTSAAWWLMPIFLTWVGGLIAWGVVREKDRGKARRLLFLGIGMTVFLDHPGHHNLHYCFLIGAASEILSKMRSGSRVKIQTRMASY